jgi:RNA polymerase sigma-70 factor (ECF subfamily)
MLSDSRLAERAFQGSEGAFNQLVEKYQTPIFNFCYRLLGGAPEAEDAAQETFLRAFEHRQRYDPRWPVKTWLMAIAAHNCIDRLRRRRQTWLSLEDDQLRLHPALRQPDPGPEAVVLKAERCRELHRQLARLSPADRQVIVLHYWGYLTYGEIAAAMGTSLPAVKSRLHRARGRLAELLRQPPAHVNGKTLTAAPASLGVLAQR